MRQRSPTTEILTYLSGYLAHKQIVKLKCPSCKELLKEENSISRIIQIKTIPGATLTEPTKPVVELLVACEQVFVANYLNLFYQSSVVANLIEMAKDIYFETKPCHPDLKKILIKDFMILRCRQQCRLVTQWLKLNKRS